MIRFKKLAASVAAITTALSLSVGTLAVTANEVQKAIDAKPAYTAAEKQFIESYEKIGMGRDARFFVDNGVELSEAEKLIDMYIEGKKLREQQDSKKLSTISNRSNPKYYSETKLSGQQHYGVVIFKGNSTGTYNPGALLNYIGMYHSFPSNFGNNNIKAWNNTIVPNIGFYGDRIELDFSGDATVTSTPEAMYEFEFGVGIYATSEYDIRSHFDFCDDDYNPDLFEYETYIQGDINHDGWVDSLDYSYIYEYNMMTVDEDDLRANYANNNYNCQAPVPAVARRINELAADLNKDGQIGLADLIMISQMSYRDDLPNV